MIAAEVVTPSAVVRGHSSDARTSSGTRRALALALMDRHIFDSRQRSSYDKIRTRTQLGVLQFAVAGVVRKETRFFKEGFSQELKSFRSFINFI